MAAKAYRIGRLSVGLQGSCKFFGQNLSFRRQTSSPRPIAFAASGARVVDKLFNFCGQVCLGGVELFALRIRQILLRDGEARRHLLLRRRSLRGRQLWRDNWNFRLSCSSIISRGRGRYARTRRRRTDCQQWRRRRNFQSQFRDGIDVLLGQRSWMRRDCSRHSRTHHPGAPPFIRVIFPRAAAANEWQSAHTAHQKSAGALARGDGTGLGCVRRHF